MTLDERLERLTERHEALTQTVELLAGDAREIHALVREIADNVGQIVKIVMRHEERLDNLERGI